MPVGLQLLLRPQQTCGEERRNKRFLRFQFSRDEFELQLWFIFYLPLKCTSCHRIQLVEMGFFKRLFGWSTGTEHGGGGGKAERQAQPEVEVEVEVEAEVEAEAEAEVEAGHQRWGRRSALSG